MGNLDGTLTITAGTPPTVVCLQQNFVGTITPGGAEVGSFVVSTSDCQPGATVPFLNLLLDHGNFVFSP